MTAMPRRVKSNMISQVDWPLMVQEIRRHGYSLKNIEELTGLSICTLRSLEKDRTSGEPLQSALNLCDVYALVTHKKLPFYRADEDTDKRHDRRPANA